jgi:hypothetical protein
MSTGSSSAAEHDEATATRAAEALEIGYKVRAEWSLPGFR